jgi:hypothetical protein
MATKLIDLINDPKVRSRFFRRAEANGPRCCIGKERITMAQMQAEEVHQIKGGIACSDHYYQALGEEIERHPILSPSVRRG